MKFIVSRDLRENRFLSNVLVFFLFQILLFIAFNVLYESHKWGLYPSEIITNILGNEELFVSPLSLVDILVNIHIELFMYLFMQTMLIVIFFRTSYSERAKSVFTFICLISVVVNSFAPVLIHFFAVGFVWVKVIAFWGVTLSGAILALINMKYLILSPRKGKG